MSSEDETNELPSVGVGGDGRIVNRTIGRFSNWAGWVGDPGEFDIPPSEPVTLVGDIPWELRDDDQASGEPPDGRDAN